MVEGVETFDASRVVVGAELERRLLPFPVELLRFLERATPPDAAKDGPAIPAGLVGALRAVDVAADETGPREAHPGSVAVPAATMGG